MLTWEVQQNSYLCNEVITDDHFFFFFFLRGSHSTSTRFHTEKPRQHENYNEVPLSSSVVFYAQDAAPAKPAAPPPTPWTGRLPHAVGESTLLGAGAPPPCSTEGNTALARRTCNFKIVNRRLRHLSDAGEGGDLSRAPRSHEQGRDGRSAAELRRSRTIGGGDHRRKRPLRQHHYLPSAAG